ncbi:MFS transporter [candidate division KSB1 bacterium]|nr:MFS transporter [candidate division KSB1 bacterium]
MIFRKLKAFYAPAPHIDPVPDSEITKLYARYRWSTLESTFLGYATFYLVRNNLSTVAKDIEGALHYTHNMIGSILAITAITYGLGKFLMGSLSDRSNPRKFMASGLLLTAICNFAFGSVGNYSAHLALWALNGFIQGMGWPPCGRSIGHWFSLRERGSIFAIWNVAHNIGGGIAGILAAFAASHFGWSAAFYFPGIIAAVGSVYLFWRLRDTPQSVGLPAIENFKHVYTNGEKKEALHEKELGTRELFVEYIFKNKYLWMFAIANFFVYIVRYSMLDWGPTFLREMKGASLEGGGIAILIIEFGGIPSTLLMGWVSDKFQGRRGMVSLLCMIPILAAFAGIYLTPTGHLNLDMMFLAIVGFFVYPPVMLLGVAGLDLTSKKAVGTAAGFIGLFGYMGRTVQAKGFGWMVDYFKNNYSLEVGWNMVIIAILCCTLISIILLAFTWHIKPKA